VHMMQLYYCRSASFQDRVFSTTSNFDDFVLIFCSKLISKVSTVAH
jgi:hypothetical protein